MAGTYVPNIPGQFLVPGTTAGTAVPAAGHQLFSYEAGTTTKLATYSDVDLTTPNTNPIILDSAGMATIFLSSTSYKYVLAEPDDTDPPASPLWTRDNIPAIPVSAGGTGDMTGTAGETIAANDSLYLSDGSGALTAGRWYKTDADNAYSSTAAGATGFAPSAISSGASGTIRNTGRITGMSSLTAGAIYYASGTAGAVTISAPTNARIVGVADSTTSLVVLSGEMVASATVAGIVSTGAQSFAGLKTLTSGAQSDIPLTAKAPGGSSYLGVPLKLTSVYVTVGNVGAGEDDLMTYSLPASTLSADGKAVKVIAWGHSANNANAKVLKAYFGATQLLGGSGFSLTASETGSWCVGFVVLRTGAATQRAVAQGGSGPAGSSFTATAGAATTPGETLSGAITIKLTGTATTNDDITQEGMLVLLEN